MATSKILPSHPEIKRRFDLYCKVKNVEAVTVTDLARELSIKQTDLMQIILDHPHIYGWRKGFKTGAALIIEIAH